MTGVQTCALPISGYSVFTSGSSYSYELEYKVEVRNGNQLLSGSEEWIPMKDHGKVIAVTNPSGEAFASSATFNVQVVVRVAKGCKQLDKDGKVIKTYSDAAVIGTFYYPSPVALPAE